MTNVFLMVIKFGLGIVLGFMFYGLVFGLLVFAPPILIILFIKYFIL
jgi:hypothetical protein